MDPELLGQHIDMVGPDGATVPVAADQVHAALARGFAPADPSQPFSFAVSNGAGESTLRNGTVGEYLTELNANPQGSNVTPVGGLAGREVGANALAQDANAGQAQAMAEASNPLVSGVRGALDMASLGGFRAGVTAFDAATTGSFGDGQLANDYDRTAEQLNALDFEDRNSYLAGQMVAMFGPALATGGAALAGRLGLGAAGVEGVGALAGLGPSGVAEWGGTWLTRGLRGLGASEGAAGVAGMAAEGALDGALSRFAMDRIENKPLSADAIVADATIGGALGFGLGGAISSFRGASRFLTRTPGARVMNADNVVDASRMSYLERAEAIMAGRIEPAGGVVPSILANSPLHSLDESGRQMLHAMSDPSVQRVLDEAGVVLPRSAENLAGHLNQAREQANNLIAAFRRGEHVSPSLFTGSEDALRIDAGVQALDNAVGRRVANREVSRLQGSADFGLERLRQELGANISAAGQRAIRDVQASAAQLSQRVGVNAAESIQDAAARANGSSSVPPKRGARRAAMGEADTVMGEAGARAAAVAPKDMAKRYQELLQFNGTLDEAIGSLDKLDPVRKALENVRNVARGFTGDEAAWGQAAKLQRRLDDALAASGNGLNAQLRGASMADFMEEGKRQFSAKGLARVLGTEGVSHEGNLFEALQMGANSLDELGAIAAERGVRGGAEIRQSARAMVDTLQETRIYALVNSRVQQALTQELRGSGLGRQLFPAARLGVNAVSGAVAGSMLGNVGLAGAVVGGVAGALMRPVNAMMKYAQLGAVFRRQGTRSAQGFSAISKAINTTGRTLAKVARPSFVYSAFNGIRTYSELKSQYEDVKAEIDELRNGSEALLARIEQQSAAVHAIDPDLGMQVQATLVRAATYLDANLPRTPEDPMGLRTPTPPSASEMSAFVARYRAIDDPVSVLFDFAAGTLRSESVEALKYVYPELHAQYAAGISQAFIEAKRVPYQARIQAAAFFGVPDQTMTPSFLAAMQSNYHQTEQQARTNQAVSRRNPTSMSRQAESATDRFQGA